MTVRIITSRTRDVFFENLISWLIVNMSNRKQLHLQDGPDANATLDVIVSENGTQIKSNSGELTISASALKIKQDGQPVTDIFTKFQAVETQVTGNNNDNNRDIGLLDGRVTTVNGNLENAELDLGEKNTAAQIKLAANTTAIEDEGRNRGTAVDAVDLKFSKDFAGNSTQPAGALYTINANLDIERAKIVEETKQVGGDDPAAQGGRERALNEVEKDCEDAVKIQQDRIDALEVKMNNFFGAVTPEEVANLGTLITQYKAADTSLTTMLTNSKAALTNLKGVVDSVFPPGSS